MKPRDAVFAAIVAFVCLALAIVLVAADIAWPAMLSGYSGGGGSASITPNSCTLPNVATGIDATGTLTCTQPSNVTGNAATATLATAATALAADPANCTNANEFARGVLASGVAECAQPAFSNLSGTAAVTQGGTGLTAVAQGDLLYGSASNTLTALTKNTTATRYLANTGTSNNPAWAQVNMSNGITGTLPVGNGGTGLATVAQGAVLYASALDTVAGLAKSTTATRYLANTGVSNAPAWDQVDLGTGITATRLPMANIPTGGSASTYLRGDGAWATPTGASLMDVKYYTSGSNNWTKPTNAVTVHVWCIGGGGGGGSGARRGSGSSAGGGGGGSGAIAEGWFMAADLPSSPSTVTVTIGASAAGGAAAGSSGAADGANGTDGNASTFGSYLTARGGQLGGGGSTTTGSSGSGGGASPYAGRNGGSTLTGAGGDSAGCGGGGSTYNATVYSPGAGGAGGGGNNTTINAGGNGGDACISGTAKGAGGSNSAYGNAGGAGTSAPANTRYGGGGGGGGTGANASTNGGAGGAGGAPGGGGGGGGACTSGGSCTSGKGGDGAAGGCVVETYG